jgi:TPR repeat protein
MVRRKAEAYFKKGCDEGNEMRSCYNLSTLYLMGGDADLQDQVDSRMMPGRLGAWAVVMGHRLLCLRGARRLRLCRTW